MTFDEERKRSPQDPGASEESDFQFDDIFLRAKKGEQKKLGVLLDLYRGYLLSLASNRLWPDVAAKAAPSDLVQEALIQATVSFIDFRGSTEEELRAWLRRILVRKIDDTHRHFRSFAKRDITRETPLSVDTMDDGNALLGLPTVSSAEVGAVKVEEFSMLNAALENLPEEYREAVILRSFEQKSFEEVGERLGKSAEAARKLWSRAIQALTREIQSQNSGS